MWKNWRRIIGSGRSIEASWGFSKRIPDACGNRGSEAWCRPCSVGTLDEQRRRKIMEYHGLVSYNTDKYQEDHVSWWDCVDVISSSGYYPIDQWEQELDRIEKTVLKYRKPFFFAEAGCMSRKGSGMIPNNWDCRENFAWKNSVNGIVQCLRPVRNDHGFVALLYGNGHQSCLLRPRHGRTTVMKYVRNRCRW